MISPAKYGCLLVFHFHKVATQLPEVYFWALSPASITSRTLEVIKMFPDDILFIRISLVLCDVGCVPKLPDELPV